MPQTPEIQAVGTLLVRLVGQPVWHDGQGAAQPLSRKDAALLALLALEGAVSRDRVAALLWPEAPPRSAHASLRQRLHRLRRASGHAVAELGELVRPAEGVQFDVGEGASTDDEPGRLLGPFEYDDGEGLAEWVARMRERGQARRAEALAGEAAAHESAGELARAIAVTERLLRLSPLLEHAWRRLMRLHYLRGDRAAALAAFERCEQLLRHELGTRPDAETLALLAVVESSAAPPQAARLLPLPAALLRPPKLIGRDAVWRALENAWAAGRPFLLVAPAGLGKSRLWGDFLQGRAGVLALRGRAGDGSTPYALFSRLLEKALAEYPVALPESTRRELARLLPALGTAPRGPGQQGALWHAVELALGLNAQAGLQVLAVDDLQFADPASVDLLRWLSASHALGRVRLALATRPDDGSPAWRALAPWLTDSTRPELVPLTNWTPDDVAALLATLGLPGLEEPGLALALHRHAGGHPFFTCETLKAHVQRAAGPGTPWAQPPSAMALLDARLDSLTPEALNLLRLAAVVGSVLDATLMARLAGCSVLALAPHWALLEASGCLRGAELAHDLVRESVLRRLPAPIAATLHAQVAGALQEGAQAQPARVAAHWRAAGRWPEAAAAFRAAAVAARGAGRLAEQAELLDEACAASENAGDADGCFEALHAALDSALIRGGGQAMLDQAQRLQPWARSPQQQLRLQLARANALLNLGRHADALHLAQAALPAAAPHPELLPDALCLLGQALAQAGRLEEAIAALRHSEQLSGSDVQHLHVQSALAFACLAGNRLGDALQAQRQALVWAQRVGDAAEVASAHGNLASLSIASGDPREAHEQAQAAAAAHADLGSAEGVHAAINLINLGQAAAWCGRTAEGLATLQRAAQLLGEHTGATAWTKARVALAALQLAMGEREAARATLAVALPGAPPVMALQWQVLRARAGHADAAVAARAVVAKTPAVQRQLTVWPLWADLAEPRAGAAALAALREEARSLPAVVHTLALCEARLRCQFDAAGAVALAEPAAAAAATDGLMPTVWPADAWLVLAQACAAQGRHADAAQAAQTGCDTLAQADVKAQAPVLQALRGLLVTAQ